MALAIIPVSWTKFTWFIPKPSLPSEANNCADGIVSFIFNATLKHLETASDKPLSFESEIAVNPSVYSKALLIIVFVTKTLISIGTLLFWILDNLLLKDLHAHSIAFVQSSLAVSQTPKYLTALVFGLGLLITASDSKDWETKGSVHPLARHSLLNRGILSSPSCKLEISSVF